MANTTWKQVVLDTADAYREANGTTDKIPVGQLADKVRAGAGTPYEGDNPLTIGQSGFTFPAKTLLKDGLQIINGVNGEDLTDTVADQTTAVEELMKMVSRKIAMNNGEGQYVWKKYDADMNLVGYVVSAYEDEYLGEISEYATLEVGSSVFLNVNGEQREFIVVNQGKPSSLYDDSCDGTWLMMKDVYELRAWDNAINDYQDSDIHAYLNSTFFDSLDSDTKASIKQVKLPYHAGNGSGGSVASGSNGIPSKVFLLSGYEVGWTNSTNQYFPVDGACLSYFSGTSATDAKRIGNYEGEDVNWWLRSPYTNNTTVTWRVSKTGGYAYDNCSTSYGIRPTLILPTRLPAFIDGYWYELMEEGVTGIDFGEVILTEDTSAITISHKLGKKPSNALLVANGITINSSTSVSSALVLATKIISSINASTSVAYGYNVKGTQAINRVSASAFTLNENDIVISYSKLVKGSYLWFVFE